MNQPLAFGDVEVAYALEQFECRGTVQASFFRIDFLGRFDARVCKKLLRFAAGLSSRAMITPVDFCHEFAPKSSLVALKGGVSAALTPLMGLPVMQLCRSYYSETAGRKLAGMGLECSLSPSASQ